MRAPTLLLLLFALLALTLAAQDAPSPALVKRQNAAAVASANAAAAADEPADDAADADDDTTAEDDTKATPTPTATPKDKATSTSSPTATTKVAQGVAATDEGSVPDLTTRATSTKSTASTTKSNPNSNTDTPPSLDSDLPTLGEIEGWSKPVLKGPSPAQNPWMQTSSLPEGTVFIAVGSVLAGLALLTIIWRGLVAYALHRSVLRAGSTTAYIDPKPKPKAHSSSPGAFYAQGPGSTLSLDHLAASGRHHTPNSSLFFSPTSNAAAQQQGQRQSTYLPAGFYASAGGQRGSVVGTPGSRGGGSTAGTERMSGMRVNESDTSLNVPSNGRAPSAYLEDLFESHKGADQPGMPPMPPQGRY